MIVWLTVGLQVGSSVLASALAYRLFWRGEEATAGAVTLGVGGAVISIIPTLLPTGGLFALAYAVFSALAWATAFCDQMWSTTEQKGDDHESQ